MFITDAKFKTFGCGSAIASSSLATEWLKVKAIDDAMKIDNMDIVEELGFTTGKNSLLSFSRGCY
jgi:nitrogen fixation NifU-like protein